MTPFNTQPLPAQPDVIAPDGSNVRILLSLAGGSMAHFELPAGQTSLAVQHRTVEEIWYILAGQGEMWRCSPTQDTVTPLQAGLCLTIPVGTAFQFRALGETALTAVAITMPPWPGADEAQVVAGKWSPTVAPQG